MYHIANGDVYNRVEGIALPGKIHPELSHARQPNKHQLKTEAMRRRLMKSARRIFARDGFEAARIEDIAADSGHTRGAFYAHFKSKEDLFFALLEQESREHLSNIRKLFEQSADSEERLNALCHYYVGRSSDRQWVMLLLEFRLFALRHSKLRAKLADMNRRILVSTKAEMLQGLGLSGMPWDAASEEPRRAALEAVLSGLVLENAFDPKRISEQQLTILLQMMFNLLIRDAIPVGSAVS